MRVLHINTYEGNGGAGRACLRLNDALNVNGISSDVLVYLQLSESNRVFTVTSSPVKKAKAVVKIMAERYLSKAVTNNTKVPFSLQWFGTSLLNNPEVRKADLIHLHWINHGFLSPRFIGELKKLNKPLVWTFHDSNPLTGGCHVRYDCQGYLHACGNCPVLRSPGNHDFSNKTWNAKYKAYSELDFHIVTPSTWMGRSAQEASLTKGKPVTVIANALETDIFKPGNKAESRKALDIAPDALVILAGYMPSKEDRHKGLKELRETLLHLSNNHSIDQDKLLLVFYGSDGKDIDLDIPVKYRFAGRINDDALLVRLYTAADVFLFPSIEESMGYTALESLSCGTPVAGFNTTGVTDVVLHKKNGYLAPLYNTRELAEGIVWILKEGEGALSANARDHAVTGFSMDVIARKHAELYAAIAGNAL